jgi:hypothetical protein
MYPAENPAVDTFPQSNGSYAWKITEVYCGQMILVAVSGSQIHDWLLTLR